MSSQYQVEDVTGTPVETVTYFFGGVAVATDRDGNVEFLHVDHLGSPIATTNSSGTVIGTQAFFPFGEVRASTGSFDTERGFTGQIADVGTGLNFYNARYQDPALGRFISPDSIVPDPFNPTDRNRFVYVRNGPLVFTDPTGHWLNIVVGAVVGAASGAAIEAGVQLGKSLKENRGFAWSDIDRGKVWRAAGRGALVGATVATAGAGAAFLKAGYGSTIGLKLSAAGSAAVSAATIDQGSPLATDEVLLSGIIGPIAEAVGGPLLMPTLEIATYQPSLDGSAAPAARTKGPDEVPLGMGNRSFDTGPTETFTGIERPGESRRQTTIPQKSNIFIPSYIFDGSM